MSNPYNTTDGYATPPRPRLTNEAKTDGVVPGLRGRGRAGPGQAGFRVLPRRVLGPPSGRAAALPTGGKMAAILQLSQYCTFRTDSISTVITEPGQPGSPRARRASRQGAPDGSAGPEARKGPSARRGAEGKAGRSRWLVRLKQWRAGCATARRTTDMCFVRTNDEPPRIHQTSFLPLSDVASTEQGFTDSIFLTSIIHAVNIYWRSTVFQDIFWMSRNWRWTRNSPYPQSAHNQTWQ